MRSFVLKESSRKRVVRSLGLEQALRHKETAKNNPHDRFGPRGPGAENARTVLLHDKMVKGGASMMTEKWIRDLFAAYEPYDEEKVLSLHTDDYVYEDVARGVVVRGKAQFAAFLREFFSAFPDYKGQLTSSFVSGDRACVEYVMTGTHTGDLPGLPATGKRISLRMAEIWELRDGKIAKASSYYDAATMLRQLGMLPSTPQG